MIWLGFVLPYVLIIFIMNSESRSHSRRWSSTSQFLFFSFVKRRRAARQRNVWETCQHACRGADVPASIWQTRIFGMFDFGMKLVGTIWHETDSLVMDGSEQILGLLGARATEGSTWKAWPSERLENVHCTGLPEYGKSHLFVAQRGSGTELVQLEDAANCRTLTSMGLFALQCGPTPLPDLPDDWVIQAGSGWTLL